MVLKIGSACFLSKRSPLPQPQAKNVERKYWPLTQSIRPLLKHKELRDLEKQVLWGHWSRYPNSNSQVLTSLTRDGSFSRAKNSTFSEAQLLLHLIPMFVPLIFCTPVAEDESFYMLPTGPSDFYTYPSITVFTPSFTDFLKCLAGPQKELLIPPYW